MKINGNLGLIVMTFVTLIVGIILLTTIADNNSKLSVTSTGYDDAFTGSGTCTQVTTGCIVSLTSVLNDTTTAEVVTAANYSLCNAGGNQDGIRVLDSVYVGSSLNATFIESTDCSYVADRTSRTLAGLLPLFFVIVLLAVGVYGLMKSGIMDKLF